MNPASSSSGTVTARFIAVGTAGFLCNYGVLVMMGKLHLPSIAAEGAAMVVALQLTFALHDNWTYRLHARTAHRHGLRVRYGGYIASNMFSSLLTVVLYALLAPLMPRLPALLAGAVVSTGWNYIVNRTVIWRQRERQAEDETFVS